MDRGRGGGRGRATKKRATLPSHHQFQETISNSPTPPPMPVSNMPSHRGGRVRPANPTPHRPSSPTADTFRVTPRGTAADRPARTHTFHSTFILESPSTSASTSTSTAVNMTDLPPSARKRAKTFETTSSFDGAEDEAHSKGGHSLRKRTRIDYTQMIDDELGLAAARNGDLVPSRSATTPGARSRKRKGAHSQDDTDEDVDDFSSNPNPKRRRADKEPGHARNASRRRNPARKSVSEISPYVYHPSDNDAVQDTIMVGVSMDVAVTDEESDHSSFQESESPSSPEGKQPIQSQPPQPYYHSEQPRVRSPSPPPYSSHPITTVEKESVSLSHPSEGFVSSNPEPNEPNWVSATLLPAAPTQPSQVQQHAREVTPAEISRSPEPILAEPEERPTEVIPTIQPAEETAVEPASLAEKILSQETQPEQLGAETGPEEDKSGKVETVDQDVETVEEDDRMEAEQGISSTQEPEQQPGKAEETATTAPTLQQEAESDKKTPSELLPLPQADGPAEAEDKSEPSPPARAPTRPVLRAPKPVGPARFGQLEPIYASETPFATRLGLEPYEVEDQILPGPYNEWVYPDEGLVTPVQTPTPTPTPTPIPRDRGSGEVVWDVTQPLREKQLFALHKQESSRRKAAGVPPISLTGFYNDCVRRHKAAKSQLPRSGAGPISAPTETFKAVVQQPTASGDETPRSGSQAPESQVPTAAPSPAPIEDERMEDPEEEVIERPPTKRNGPADPIEVTRNYPHQYSFPKVRDPTDISDLLENFEDMDTDTLYSTVAAAVETLDAYQREYYELKKILDDEENAKRRQANDKTIVNWENRQNYEEPLPMRRHHDDAIKGPPPFEVRGARAPKPYIDDPVLEHQREEDRIMAQVYGFKHNNHPTQVGRQNPEEQRWEMPETRLRERKRTEKGAELAEENVVEGKRARKPRYVSDQSKDPSRSGTPVLGLGTGRRQRKTTALSAVNGDSRATPEVVLPPPSENVLEMTPRKARAAAAAARARQMAEDREETPVAIFAEPESMQADEEDVSRRPKPVQKRVRGANKAPTSVPTTEATKTAAKGKARATKGHATTEISSSSFYSTPSLNAQFNDYRPGTASSEESNRTAETNESAYSLRDKPKRNFLLENDPELEPRPKRRVRTVAAQKADTSGPQKVDDVNEGKKAKRVRKPAAPAATNAPVSLEPTTSAHAQAPEPAPAPGPVPQPELAYPLPPIVSQQLAPPPPPPPAGGLKAPTIFFTNPVTAHTIAPAPPPPGPFMHTFNAVTSFPHSFPPPQADPPAIKKPITRIKVTNGPSQGGQSANSKNGNSSEGRHSNGGKKVTKVKASKPASALSPNGLIDGKLPTLSQLAAEVPEKSYSEMSKSEKMSWSMRRRWASGEMQGAVEKRRTTLANKKAEKASTNEGGSNPGSGASTPQPQSGVLHPPPQEPHQPQQQMMTLPTQGPLALPGPYGDQGYVGMQPPIQMQMQQPQGYGGHGHPHGHGHGHGHAHPLPPPSPMQMVPGGQPGGQMVFQFPAQPQHPHPGFAPGQHY
ncbi:hypothetical protein QBC44DRAFT_399875 [Cladorrhinum sp. PSN332]|nr:hypothetical protein QBC44DRAFT_399875 [Cladorrhinum sp. PSN332]